MVQVSKCKDSTNVTRKNAWELLDIDERTKSDAFGKVIFFIDLKLLVLGENFMSSIIQKMSK